MDTCMHFESLGDLILALGSLLGLLAIRRLASLKLLGGPTALLVSYAVEHDVVCRWSCATSWQSLYLTTLWVGSLAFRAATMLPDPSLQDVVQACAFVLSSLTFMGLVFSIQHVSSILCILIDSYVLRGKNGMDA